MGILDRDLKEIDLHKQDAYRLTATYNEKTKDKYFDWVMVRLDGNVMLHTSMFRLRKKQLPEDQKDNLKDFLPPLILAVDKSSGEKSIHFATDNDKTEENIKKVEDMTSYIYAEFNKFSARYLERGKTSSFDDITTEEERYMSLYDDIPTEEFFKLPKTVHDALFRKQILEARMRSCKDSYERAQIKHFLGYD